MKQRASIHHWFQDGDRLIGEVRGHPNQDTFSSDVQRTSKVLILSRESGIAETQNTIYTLGEERIG